MAGSGGQQRAEGDQRQGEQPDRRPQHDGGTRTPLDLLGTAGAALLDAPISTVMTSDVVVTGPGDTVEDMMRLMTDRRIRHVPVVSQDGRLAGIISIGDVVKSRIDELEADRDQLIGYIQSGR